MIEMQVGIHHIRHVRRTETRLIKRSMQLGMGIIHGIDAGKFLIDLGTDTVVDEDNAPVSLQQKATQSKSNPVPVVRPDMALP